VIYRRTEFLPPFGGDCTSRRTLHLPLRFVNLEYLANIVHVRCHPSPVHFCRGSDDSDVWEESDCCDVTQRTPTKKDPQREESTPIDPIHEGRGRRPAAAPPPFVPGNQLKERGRPRGCAAPSRSEGSGDRGIETAAAATNKDVGNGRDDDDGSDDDEEPPPRHRCFGCCGGSRYIRGF
jgi:hypothetical protein